VSSTDQAARSESVLAGLRFEIPTEPIPTFVPARSDDTEFFWRGPGDVLRMLTCGACGRITHPPGPVCGYCRSRDVAPQPVSGRGTVYAWTVNVQPFVPGLLPYCAALVTIDEQADVKITTQLVDCTNEDIHAGMPVEVLFVAGLDGTRIPFFRPVQA
jgi:uncharacterized OB-fold protein